MFSQTSEYALRAMICLASLERAGTASASSERISSLTCIPPGYLSKVMRLLVVGGLVGSQRGPNGGFSLARRTGEITMLDVIEAVEPDRATERETRHAVGLPLTPLRRRLDELAGALRESLRASTLDHVLDEMRESGSEAA